MRNIGLVSAAVIAMAAMAGAVAASTPPVIQNSCILGERTQQQWSVETEEQVRSIIVDAVASAQGAGLSGEAAQQRIKDMLRAHIEELELCERMSRSQAYSIRPLLFLAIVRANESLINDSQLRRGSDGDLAISAMLAELGGDRSAGSSANRGGGGYRSGSSGGYGGGTRSGGGGPSTAGDAGRNVPGNEAAGQPATDAATTEVQQSQTTDDSDLDDEAGEPD
jgi:uncharacterized membrane protein YgcG